MTTVPEVCQRCNHPIPLSRMNCPHCGGYQNCPNVVLARQPAEVAELRSRYQVVLADADARGVRAAVDAFSSTAAQSRAVLGSSLNKLKPIYLGLFDVFATYHELADLRCLFESTPYGPDWNILRPVTEIALLGGDKLIRHLHYAALSLDGRSLPHYGECTIILRENMIAHRASIFQENSAVYVHRHGHNLPLGSRSSWADRGLLCTIKVAPQIGVGTNPSMFSKLLLNPGATALDDEFVEVQIFGPMSFLTFEKLTVRKTGPKASSTIRPRKRRGTTDELALRDYCKKHGVDCEFV